MNNNIFEIENLKCSYDKQLVVFEVNKLQIPRGKFIVLLGKSGSGKSTFLETLGLMNNTIINGQVKFFPHQDSNPLLINDLWRNEHTGKISEIRRKYMSFIFQHTNLMPNLSALENICIAQMIQGKDYKTSAEEAKNIMKRIDIDTINDGRSASNLSGGQRQRVAFVRAISAEFNVLFGDEPTGNLDEFNTNDLIKILVESINNNGKSIIVVSHNIDIAIMYADEIIIISKRNNSPTGYIDQRNILRSEKINDEKIWNTLNGDRISEPKLFIMNAMN